MTDRVLAVQDEFAQVSRASTSQLRCALFDATAACTGVDSDVEEDLDAAELRRVKVQRLRMHVLDAQTELADLCDEALRTLSPAALGGCDAPAALARARQLLKLTTLRSNTLAALEQLVKSLRARAKPGRLVVAVTPGQMRHVALSTVVFHALYPASPRVARLLCFLSLLRRALSSSAASTQTLDVYAPALAYFAVAVKVELSSFHWPRGTEASVDAFVDADTARAPPMDAYACLSSALRTRLLAQRPKTLPRVLNRVLEAVAALLGTCVAAARAPDLGAALSSPFVSSQLRTSEQRLRASIAEALQLQLQLQPDGKTEPRFEPKPELEPELEPASVFKPEPSAEAAQLRYITFARLRTAFALLRDYDALCDANKRHLLTLLRQVSASLPEVPTAASSTGHVSQFAVEMCVYLRNLA